jgi:uncharacterized protein YndB with AHSA1/START domain
MAQAQRNERDCEIARSTCWRIFPLRSRERRFHCWHYLQVVPPEKLVFTWSGEAIQNQETVVTLDFLDRGPATEVVLTHEHLSTQKRRALVEGGWSSMLDALAEVLSSPTSTFDAL